MSASKLERLYKLLRERDMPAYPLAAHRAGRSIASLARESGVDASAVSLLVNGKTWRHVS